MPGAGFEPARPTGGHLILSQARLADFATPARLRVAAYSPAVKAYLEGIFFGGLPTTIAISW
jgi:hypothetical protein